MVEKTLYSEENNQNVRSINLQIKFPKLSGKDSPLKSVISKTKAIKIGFALETDSGESNAMEKMNSKSLDFIILNYANEDGAGCESDTNHVYIYSKNGIKKEFPKDTKNSLSQDILRYFIEL